VSAADQSASFAANGTDAFAGLVDGNKRCSMLAAGSASAGCTLRR
jgi:hypothetical protein